MRRGETCGRNREIKEDALKETSRGAERRQVLVKRDRSQVRRWDVGVLEGRQVQGLLSEPCEGSAGGAPSVSGKHTRGRGTR